jgi:tryptophan halogenase
MELPAPQIADAFQIAVEEGEIIIEFGQVAEQLPSEGDVRVTMTDRIKIPMEAARRLTQTLSEALKPHLANTLRLEAMGLSPAAAADAVSPDGRRPARPRPDSSGTQAATLLRLVSEWGAPHLYERSFQVSDSALRSNRYLLTVNASDIPGDKCASALAVCDRMAMPARLREEAGRHFPMAKCVHFGFEGDSQNIVCKLYLERAVTPDEAAAAAASGGAVMLHLAFKWSLTRAESVTTRYMWRPFLDADGINSRLNDIYRGGNAESRAIAEAFLQFAADRADAKELQFLEVEEAENARRSFDLNLYNAKLQVRDAQGLLQRVRSHFRIRPGQFQALYDQICGMPIGHVAGGLHRDGADFFNIYYGVVALPRFSSQLSRS